MKKARLDSLFSARWGYSTPPVIIILALITLFVAASLYFHTFLLKGIKNEPTTNPSPAPGVSRQSNGSTTSPAPNGFGANWKTYSNYGISFKYPSDWEEKPVLTRGSGFTLEIVSEEGFYKLTFFSQGNYNQLAGKPYSTIDEYINMPYKIKAVTVDGQEGRQPLPRAGSENVNSVVFFSKNSKFIYSLTLQTGSDAISDTRVTDTTIKEGQKLFNQILSTFKFVE